MTHQKTNMAPTVLVVVISLFCGLAGGVLVAALVLTSQPPPQPRGVTHAELDQAIEVALAASRKCCEADYQELDRKIAKLAALAENLTARLETDENSQIQERHDIAVLSKWSREFEAWVKAQPTCCCVAMTQTATAQPIKKPKGK
jgi:hypothetical protein